MVRGLTHAAQALIPRMRQQDAIAHNLANVETPAFKGERILVDRVASGDGSLGAPPERILLRQHTDFSPASLSSTGNPMDLAVEGEGFLVVRTDHGLRLSRGGNFRVAEDGRWYNPAGHVLQSQTGDLLSDPDLPPPAVAADGSTEDGQRLWLARVPRPSALSREGAGTYRWPHDLSSLPDATGTMIRSGHREGSNVSAMTEVSSMMQVFRAYEAAQRALEIQAETVRTAVERVGRVGK